MDQIPFVETGGGGQPVRTLSLVLTPAAGDGRRGADWLRAEPLDDAENHTRQPAYRTRSR